MPAPSPKDSKLVRLLAKNVRDRRNQLGLSQEDLAERAGVHRTFIGMVERSERNVTIFNIERLARALGVKANVLLSE